MKEKKTKVGDDFNFIEILWMLWNAVKDANISKA